MGIGASEARDGGIATVGTLAGFSAMVSAAACCVLPLVFAGIGVGAGVFAPVVPYRWPLTGFAVVMIGAGWLVYFRRRRACAADPNCGVSPPRRTTLVLLVLATLMTALAASWKLFEKPLTLVLTG